MDFYFENINKKERHKIDMKSNEKKILDLFVNYKSLTSKEIKDKTNIKDPSSIIRDLLYFEYLVKNEDKSFSRTTKEYNDEIRSNEKREENYEIVLNKIFTGKYLDFNLGHEVINFIKDDGGQRYVYLNHDGSRGNHTNTKYVFHIIESSITNENGIFDLVAVSEINQNDLGIYKKISANIDIDCPKFHGNYFSTIFNCSTDVDNVYNYSFKASRLLRPRDNLRIIFKIDRDEARLIKEKNKIVFELMCNPQHSKCYADATGKKTFSSEPNQFNDKQLLESLINSDDLVESNDNLNLDEIDDEECYSLISGRAQLEVSTSNLIAYFLRRDNNLVYSFLHDALNIETIERNEQFEIIREKEENIDLLFKSKNHVIVVENKIDSKINGVSKTTNTNGKYESQLSKYYNYIEKNYSNISNKKYFVLAPEYNDISEAQLARVYEKGNYYNLVSYNKVFNIFNDLVYSPLGIEPSQEQVFLFSQFKKSLEYLTWSKGKQRERTAYIRLKQRIKKLNN